MIHSEIASKALEKLRADYSHARRRVREERSALKIARQELADVTAAQDILQHAAQAVQQEAHARVASIVTRCLEAVFGEEAYEFSIDFRRKRGRTEAVLTLTRGGVVLEDPCEEAGGGVVDVAALALRLAALMCGVPRGRKLLVLDEPCRHLNGGVYQERVGGLLLALAEELGVQMLIVTDDEWLKVGKVVEM